MSQLTKSDQARINGAKSRGPKTPEGKKRSSLNAVRHGLLAKQICLTVESEADYQALLEDFLKRFQPDDGVELRCVEQIASCALRLERCHAMETALFDNEMDHIAKANAERYENLDVPTTLALAFKSLADNSKALDLYMRYEAAIGRQYDRAYKHFLSLRTKLPAEPESEIEETTKRTQVHPDLPVFEPRTQVELEPETPAAGIKPASLLFDN